MSTMQIAADRADHYSAISRSIAGISSRMAALAQQFAAVAPRTEGDDAWIDLLSASAAEMLAAAAALKEIEYAPPIANADDDDAADAA
jgi:hypothetical protein